MRIFQKWRNKIKRRELEAAIEKYNSALETMAEAAIGIREAARDSGILTEGIEAGVDNMCKISKEAAISAEDFKRGGM